MKGTKTTADGMLVKRLQNQFIKLCWKWMGDNQANKSALARHVNLHLARITELMGRKRILSMYYIRIFHRRGIFKVKDIYDEMPESEEEREIWEAMKVTEDLELQKLLAKALHGSLNRESLINILRSHITPDPNGNKN